MKTDFISSIELITKYFYDKPNKEFSTSTNLRFGTYGSLTVKIDKGIWFDHETSEGGGVFDLIIKNRGGTRLEAAKWLGGKLKNKDFQAGLTPGDSRGECPSGPETLDKSPRNYPIVFKNIDKNNQEWWRGREVEAIYPYSDEEGKLLFQVLRFKSTPKFTIRRPFNNGWIPNLDGVRRVPYRLNEFINKTPGLIFIAEGEKDVDNLYRLFYKGDRHFPSESAREAGLKTLTSPNIFVTCNPGGAGKWKESYNLYFSDFNIVILPDNDEVGRNHAQTIKSNLDPISNQIIILNLPNQSPKNDISNWINQGKTFRDLLSFLPDNFA
jgi:hypothetical protein